MNERQNFNSKNGNNVRNKNRQTNSGKGPNNTNRTDDSRNQQGYGTSKNSRKNYSQASGQGSNQGSVQGSPQKKRTYGNTNTFRDKKKPFRNRYPRKSSAIETADDIKEDIVRIQKEIELEIKEIRSLKL